MCFSSCLSLFAGPAMSCLFLSAQRLSVNVDSHTRAMRAAHQGRRGQPTRALFVSAYRLFDSALIIRRNESLAYCKDMSLRRPRATAGACSSSRSCRKGSAAPLRVDACAESERRRDTRQSKRDIEGGGKAIAELFGITTGPKIHGLKAFYSTLL